MADNGAEQQGNSASAAAAGAEAALSSLVSPVFSMQGVRYGLITGCCLWLCDAFPWAQHF